MLPYFAKKRRAKKRIAAYAGTASSGNLEPHERRQLFRRHRQGALPK